jgi:uncharacterized membrane protein YgcG
MIGGPASGGQVLDQYALDMPDDATTDLADTIVGTYRAVAESGNRVAATRLCLPDAARADTLRRTVLGAGVQNVEVVSEAEAAEALARSVGVDAALLLTADDTASLTVVGEDGESTSVLASAPIGAAGAAAACATVLQRVPAAEAPIRVMLVGQRLDLASIAAELSSTTPVQVPPDAGYAIARGAAQTADEAGFAPAGAATQMAPAVDATQMAPTSAEATQMAPVSAAATASSAAVGPELAYSQAPEDDPLPMEPEYGEMPMDLLEDFVPEHLDQDELAAYTTAIAPPPPRMMLMGSAAAFVVISFVTLAVTVAINVRPAADVSAQPVPAVQSDTVPGRYLPPVPHEPDPVALPVAVLTPAPAAPSAPSVRPNTNNGPVNEVPAAPPAQLPPPPADGPAPAPVPQIGIPVIPIPPIIVLPPLNPWTPPSWPPTTPPTSTPPTTTTTTPTTTTTTTPTTTTTTPPTTTTTTPSTTTPTTTTPPSSEPSTAPPSPAYTPPPSEPPSSEASVAPVTPKEPPSAASAPAYTPAYTPPVEPAPASEVPAAPQHPQSPSGGGESSSGSGSSSGSESSGSGRSSSGRGSDEAPVTTVPVSP